MTSLVTGEGRDLTKRIAFVNFIYYAALCMPTLDYRAGPQNAKDVFGKLCGIESYNMVKIYYLIRSNIADMKQNAMNTSECLPPLFSHAYILLCSIHNVLNIHKP